MRPAQPGDTPDLSRIEELSFSDPWIPAHLERDSRLIATVDDRVVGFLIWRQLCDATPDVPAEFEILNVAVDPDFRRQGIARALLAALLDQPGHYFLEVRKSNLPAQTLYATLGFVPVGTRKNYYRHPRESAIVMRMKRC